MKIATLAVPALALAVSACAEVQTRATDLGVSPAVQTACTAAAAQEIGGISDPTLDFDAVLDRLKAKGKACLIAAAQDVLTAKIIAAAPAIAGEVVAADPVAAAAIAE